MPTVNTFDPALESFSIEAPSGSGSIAEFSVNGEDRLVIRGDAVIPSAASAVLRDIYMPAGTTTVSGSTGITTSTGFNKVEIGANAITSAANIANAATVYIAGPPTISGGGAITNAASLVVGSGRVGITTNAPACTLDIGTYNTYAYTFKAGSFIIQPYALNNGFIAENAYYNGSAWTRISDGYASGLHYASGSVLMFANDTGSGTLNPVYSLKVDAQDSGTVALGGTIAFGSGIYTGSIMTVYGTGKVTTDANVIIGASAAGASAAKCLVLSNSATAPSASADLCHLYSADDGAGKATLAIWCEETVAAVTTEVLSGFLPAIINGVEVKLALIA